MKFEFQSKLLSLVIAAVLAPQATRCAAASATTTTEATPLKRGLMALHTSDGNLVSWRAHKSDSQNLRFRLWRGVTATSQTTKVNSGNLISGKTNYLDTSGTATAYYRLEVVDQDGNVVEEDVSMKTWDNQNYQLQLTAGAPTDPQGLGATYHPDDCGYADMDGDGEYEMIVCWMPSNMHDAASSGMTSNVFYDCYKLDGTHLWRIDMGQDFFASHHTMQFIAWDFDGDGYGEFMIKTAPGTKDGQGNYVVLNDDDPTKDWRDAKYGKQFEGPEYITVFNGTTGAEMATIPYHTDYAAGASVWGDSYGNRSERYLAAIAWLDGEDQNPSPIFARGYYAGAFVGAYDWDGTTLSERWVSRNTTSGEGLWGEGAHWISVGDCDGDGKQDIVYGAAALKSDGSLLYRTGLGHGDALHLGDFDPDNDGLEVWMCHESSPYGADLRDAATGRLLWHPTSGGDTGRALAAHYNSEAEGAYLQHSASKALFDWNGDTIRATGGYSQSLNNRIYWTGDLAEEYYDKTVIEHYDPTTNGFQRVQVNGTNYVTGSRNGGSKQNPCIMGDILGDWREETILWGMNADSTYYLVFNATNYETPYKVPHLMEDANYRAQVINQNCCYNQPPHLSYNLRNAMKVDRELFFVGDEMNADNADLRGQYWDCFYTTYPVIIPENVTAWKVGRGDNQSGLVKLTKLDAGFIVPAGQGIIYNSAEPVVTFTPTALTPGSFVGSTIVGDYGDVVVPTSTELVGYYEFRNGEQGLGFYKADGETVAGRTGYMRLISITTDSVADSYVLGDEYFASTMGVSEVSATTNNNSAPIYDLSGRQIEKTPAKGVYLQNGKKILIK